MDEADALARDAADPLSSFRDRFLIPDGPAGPDGPNAVYLAGQSLGLQPRTVRGIVEGELDRWARLGVDAWFQGDRPWFSYDDSLREPMARIVGARPSEVAILNTLTIDLHLLLTSFFRPAGRRRRILADGPLFPSDRYALVGHLAGRSLDPAMDLIVVGPRDGESTVRPDDLERAIAEHGPELATVLLGGVKTLRESRNMAGVPILNKIPYVSRLFKNTGVGRETQSLMLMVTPRIIIQEEEEQLLGVAD